MKNKSFEMLSNTQWCLNVDQLNDKSDQRAVFVWYRVYEIPVFGTMLCRCASHWIALTHCLPAL